MGEVNIKGVHGVKAKGRRYYYHRKTGIRLQSRYGTKAFLDEVYAINQSLEQAEKGYLPGTWGALVDKFLKSNDFANLAPRTQSDYRDRILKPLSIDTVAILDMTPPTILQLRDAIYDRHGAKQANYTLAVMSRIFKWGMPYEYTRSNPCETVPRVKVKNKPRANRPWLPYEIKAVMDAATPELRLILALLMTGLRSGDAMEVAWSSWNEEGFAHRSNKTNTETWIVPSPTLIECVNAAPKCAVTIATNQSGNPWTLGGLRSAWRRLKQRLETEGRIGGGLTLHGIRHTVGNALAEAGIGTSGIASVLGHKSEQMAQHYSNRAKRKKDGASAASVIGRIGK